MPVVTFICEVCGVESDRYSSKDKVPRFCSNRCKRIGMAGQATKPSKYKISPEDHDCIKKVYQGNMERGSIKKLAIRINIPYRKITNYAANQGWSPRLLTPRKKWGEEELRILKLHAKHCPEVIQRKFKEAGFDRTVNSILLKRKRMRLTRSCLDGYSANSLALCLGVDPHMITRAIKSGALKATTVKTNRTKQQGGNPYWITEKNIRGWIINNAHAINLSKVDKYWFIDILTN